MTDPTPLAHNEILNTRSSVTINQNHLSDTDPPQTFDIGYVWSYQPFVLPTNYVRGTDQDERHAPDISGFELATDIDPAYQSTAAFDYTLDYQIGNRWINLVSGTAAGAAASGDHVWFTVHFAEPIHVTTTMLSAKFRLGIRGRPTPPYTGCTALRLRKQPPHAPSRDNFYGWWLVRSRVDPQSPGYNPDDDTQFEWLTFVCKENKLRFDKYGWYDWKYEVGGINYHVLIRQLTNQGGCLEFQYGVNGIKISKPPPPEWLQADLVANDGTDPLIHGADEFTFMFRLLTLSLDEGTDDTNIDYRNTVRIHSAKSLSTETTDPNTYWMSKPNPSKFAVESLYLDVRDSFGGASVVDHFTIDPLTPGPYFSVYYSDEGDPGVTVDDWDGKLWTKISANYQLRKTETYALPEPITTKYIKLEFTNLQARSYTTPDIILPTKYKKHPKWVLEYFLARAQDFVVNNPSGSQGVTFNAYKLAYDYYLDDLQSSPDPTIDTPQLKESPLETGDLSNKVDPQAQTQINLALQPYASISASDDFSLSSQIGQGATTIESINNTAPFSSFVSSVNRDAVVFEKTFPALYFFLPCRHVYREVSGSFEHARAYFVGLKSLSLHRDHYTIDYDNPVYIERGGDMTNIEQLDLSVSGEGFFAY